MPPALGLLMGTVLLAFPENLKSFGFSVPIRPDFNSGWKFFTVENGALVSDTSL